MALACHHLFLVQKLLGQSSDPCLAIPFMALDQLVLSCCPFKHTSYKTGENYQLYVQLRILQAPSCFCKLN